MRRDEWNAFVKEHMDISDRQTLGIMCSVNEADQTQARHGHHKAQEKASVQPLPVREKRPRCVAPIGHGAEFYQAKNALPPSGTRLGKERISPHRHSARHRQQQKKRRQNQQRRQRQEKIQQPFPEPCVHMHRIRSSSARSRSPDPARRVSSCCRSAGTARDGRGRSRHRQHRRICMRWLSRGHCPRA